MSAIHTYRTLADGDDAAQLLDDYVAGLLALDHCPAKPSEKSGGRGTGST